MRATAVCIQGPSLTRKRKALEDVANNNKIMCINKTVRKIDTATSCEGSEQLNDTISLNSESSFESPKQSITQKYFQLFVDKLKESARRIMPLSLSSILQELPIHPEKKQEHVSGNQDKRSTCSKYLKVRRKLFSVNQNRPYSLISTASIPTDLFSPIHIKPKYRFTQTENGDNKENAVTLSKVQTFERIQEYLKERKTLLFRSRTGEPLSHHAVVTASDMKKFLWLVEEDPMVSLFIKRDICRRYADKYLLSMVFAYFARAKLDHSDYSRENFFAALYLAHDMEEEDEDLKYEVFPYCLGTTWRNSYPYLLSIRDDLFWAIRCRAVVSKRCCDQVMSLMPGHWIWERERPEYHTQIIREKPNDDGYPRGPYGSPIWCRACLERECLDSDNSYLIYSSVSETSSSSPLSREMSVSPKNKVAKDSGFESFLALPQDDDEGSEDKENQDPNAVAR